MQWGIGTRGLFYALFGAKMAAEGRRIRTTEKDDKNYGDVKQ